MGEFIGIKYTLGMAAPATHIVLATKVFDRYFRDLAYPDFVVGTSFPDIRYTGVIDREKTHFSNLTIDQITKEDSFTAGLKLHSLVDEVREEYVKSQGLYKLFPESQFLTQGVKFFEDQVLYGKIENWKEITNYFSSIYDGELAFGVSREDIEKWHGLLKRILSRQITENEIIYFVSEIGRPPLMSNEIIRVIGGLKDKDKATEIVLDFYDNFEKLIGSEL